MTTWSVTTPWDGWTVAYWRNPTGHGPPFKQQLEELARIAGITYAYTVKDESAGVLRVPRNAFEVKFVRDLCAAWWGEERVPDVPTREDAFLVGVELSRRSYVGSFRTYQLEAAAAIAALGGALLCDEPGLGKSRTALAATEFLAPPERVRLIVGPSFTRAVWRRELEALGLLRDEHDWCALEGLAADEDPTGRWWFCHYEILEAWRARLLVPGRGSRFKPYAMIADELHNAANPRAQRTKAILAVAAQMKVRIGLTGTPVGNKPAELWPLLTFLDGPKSWGSWLDFRQRYCLPPDAPVTMGDFTTKSIGDIVPGDVVIGWHRLNPVGGNRSLTKSRVLAVLRRRASLARVLFADGTSVVATPDHKWLKPPKRGGDADIGQYYELTAGRDAVRVLSPVVPPSYVDSLEYRAGYLSGVFRGDGHVARYMSGMEHAFETAKSYNGVKKHVVQLRVNDKEIVDRIAGYFTQLGLVFSRDVSSTANKSGKPAYEIRAHNKIAFDALCAADSSTRTSAWYAGFLGGVYDAEGSGRVIAQLKRVNPTTWSLIQEAFAAHGFVTRCSKDEKAISFYCPQREEFLRFWRTAWPAVTRKLDAALLTKGAKFMSQSVAVVSVEPLPGEHEVVTLTTETGNYIAYGLGSKNCSAYRDDFGWRDGEPSNVEELQARMGGRYIRRTKKDVKLELPPMRREAVVVPADAADQLADEERRLVLEVLLRRQGHEQTLKLIGALRKKSSKGKVPSTLALLEKLDSEPVVVFCNERAMCDQLAKKVGEDAVVVHGALSLERRDEAVAAFQAGTGRVLIATYGALREGVTLTRASNLILHDLDWKPSVLLQAEARAHRFTQENPVTIYWMILRDSIDDLFLTALKTKADAIERSVAMREATDAMEEIEADGVEIDGRDAFARDMEVMLRW